MVKTTIVKALPVNGMRGSNVNEASEHDGKSESVFAEIRPEEASRESAPGKREREKQRGR